MRTKALMAAFLTLVVPPAVGLSGPGPGPSRAGDSPRPGVHYIDSDGDGYGVAGPRGPDADDADPNVNTPDTVAAKYADIRQLLGKLGYRPRRIFYVSPDGADRTGRADDPARPFATWGAAGKLLRPGDAVLFRRGTYAGKYAVGCSGLRGTADRPILIAAFPGERVIVDATVKGIDVADCRWVIFDGFVVTNTASTWGSGVAMRYSAHVTLRHIESTRHARGWIGMQDLHDVLAERCVFHDNPNSHGVYLGAREKPNSDLTVRDCLLYRNGRHGFQHNGRVTNLRLLDNGIHTNNLAGVSLIMGVSRSLVRGNRIFNNNKQGIVFYAYDDRNPAILPYDQCDNVVEKNIVWVGRHSWNGRYRPENYAAILFNDTTAAQKMRMDRNAFRGNVLVTRRGEAFRFSQARFAGTTTIESNIIHRAAGEDGVFSCGGKVLDFRAFQASSPRIRGNRFADPQFADVSVDYYRTPGAFDFTVKDSRRRGGVPGRSGAPGGSAPSGKRDNRRR